MQGHVLDFDVRICVFCGSHEGNRPEFRETAKLVGRLLAERGLGIVYGGGRVGLMARWPTPRSPPADG